MTKSQGLNLEPRLVAIGLNPRFAKVFALQIRRWVIYHGEEWTVNRLKALKVGYLHHLAGLPYRDSYASRPDGRPRGCFGTLWSKTMRKQLVLSVLNVYKSFRSRKVTLKQLEKFYGSMQRDQPVKVFSVVSALAFFFEKVLPKRIRDASQAPRSSFTANLSSGKSVPIEERRSLDHWVNSPERRSPGIELLTEKVAHFTTKYVPKLRVTSEAGMPLVQHALILIHPDLPEPLKPIKAMLDGRIDFALAPAMPSARIKFSAFPPLRGDYPFHAGRISFIQEPGYKLRAVANPYRVFQWFLEPLGRALFRALSFIESDCTFDQAKGVRFVADKLKSGEVCCSVDISDATNNFPLSVQIEVLDSFAKQSGMEELLPLIAGFEALAKAPWLCPDGEYRSWTVGQPLGLFPSFPSFALTHCMLLSKLTLQKGGWFRVLGDDVCMSESLYKPYLDALQDMGVPVSPAKTISSDRLAEFAGKVILRDAVLSPFNHGRLTDDSFWDFAKNVGPRVLPLLSSKQRRVIRALGEIPEPLGLGWNPSGRSLVERLPDGLLETWVLGKPIPFSVEPRKEVRDADLFRSDLGLSAFCVSPDQGDYFLPGVLSNIRSVGLPIGGNLSALEYEHRNDPGFVYNDVVKVLEREYTLRLSVRTPLVDSLTNFCDKFGLL